MIVTLGECLTVAEQRFGEAEAGGLPGVHLRAEIVVQARRLAGMLGGYLDASQAAFQVVRDDPGEWPGPVEDMRTGLRAAVTFLDAALLPAGPRGTTVDPAVGRYTAAVDALAAGHDLLRTHTGPGRYGTLEPRSEQARLLASPPLIIALAEEISGWAGRTARTVDRIANAQGQAGLLSRADLAAARDRLAAIARADIPADPAGLGAAERRHLLYSVPAAAVPRRTGPGRQETDSDLCAGIGVSARRLRAAAFTVSREPGNSPFLSGRAWRQEASAAWIICDLSEKLLQSLAGPGSAAAAAGIPAGQLKEAASGFATARTAWRHVAWMWQSMSTDTNSAISGTGAEAGDIAVRMGRLLTGDPGWKPVTRKARDTVPRSGNSLAPDGTALAAVLGAVHEAADAVTYLAGAGMTAFLGVQGTGRLYMNIAALGQERVRYEYVRAPGDRIHLMKNGRYLCEDATWNAAARIDQIALRAGVPSGTLALARAALPGGGRTGGAEPGFELDPDDFTVRLELFTRLKGDKGQDRSRIDPREVIRAYETDRMTVDECADRFTTSTFTIRNIIAAHGGQLRPRSQPETTGSEKEEPPERAPGPGRQGINEESPLRNRLHRLGVDDPDLLQRAAAIDWATADVLDQVGGERLYDSRLGRRRSAAAIAADDGPRTADAAARSAAATTSEQVPGHPVAKPPGPGARRRA